MYVCTDAFMYVTTGTTERRNRNVGWRLPTGEK
jgi:hypothetical protein